MIRKYSTQKKAPLTAIVAEEPEVKLTTLPTMPRHNFKQTFGVVHSMVSVNEKAYTTIIDRLENLVPYIKNMGFVKDIRKNKLSHSEATNRALEELKQRALEKGANCVANVKIESQTVAHKAFLQSFSIMAQGDAVYVEPEGPTTTNNNNNSNNNSNSDKV